MLDPCSGSLRLEKVQPQKVPGEVILTEGLTLILGGARSGKSTMALDLALRAESAGPVEICFIATAQAGDDEMRQRIEAHRAERPGHWRTLEEPLHLDRAIDAVGAARVVIVDCITLYVSNWLLEMDSGKLSQFDFDSSLDRFLLKATQKGRSVVCVSNEVGMGLVPEYELGRKFRDLLGTVNQRAARAANEVSFMAAGLPLVLKSVGS